MPNEFILHSVPARAVSYNDARTPYGIVSIPKVFKQPAKIACGTHEAHVVCYQSNVSGAIYCKVKLYHAGRTKSETPKNSTLLHEATLHVHLTGTNMFIKIPSVIVDAMGIKKGSHCIDWTCTTTLSIFGVIRSKASDYKSPVDF